MSRRRGPLADISWFQVAASVLAAVTSAWIASSLGVAGTLIGAALGSFVVTVSTALYGRTLHKGKTLIAQTASGAVAEKDVTDNEITTAFDEIAELEDSPIERAEIIDNPRRQLRWKTITVTAVIVLGISLVTMGAYEKIADDSFGVDQQNPRISNPFGGSSGSSDGDSDQSPDPDADRDSGGDSEPTPEPSSSPTSSPSAPAAPTPSAPARTQAPAPAPAPSATVPEPTPELLEDVPVPAPAATQEVPAE